MAVNHMMKCKGEGLIETLIAMLIIFGTIAALMNFQAGLAYNNIVNQQRSDATVLATSELETLRDFQVINTQSPYTAYQGIVSGSSTSVGVNTTFTLTWTVTATATPAYKTVNIVVGWTDPRNVAQAVNLTTIVGSIDPAYSSSIMG
jgi:Tfp pilus assembly protein PilV